MLKIIILLIFSISTTVVFAQEKFLRICEKRTEAPEEYKAELSWLWSRFENNECKTILAGLKKFKSYDQLAFAKTDVKLPTGWITSFEHLKGNVNQARYNAVITDTNLRYAVHGTQDEINKHKEKPLYQDLKFYSFLTNITHLTYSKDYHIADNYSLCSILKVFKSLKTISIDQNLLTPEVDNCMIQAGITGIIIRKQVSTFKSYVPKTKIIGIESYTGDLQELTGLTRLMYLGMIEKPGSAGNSDNLKLLLQIPALTHFDLKTPNLKNSKNIAYLEGLTWLKIKCYGKECRTDDNSFAFLKSLEYLDYLDLSYNGLSHVDEFSKIRTLFDLRTINLEGNEIQQLPSFKLPKIANLNISGNKLKNIDVLKDLTTLVTLNLSSNKISDFSAISNIPSILELNLSHNVFRNSFDDMSPMPNLKILSINGGCHYGNGMNANIYPFNDNPLVFNTDFVFEEEGSRTNNIPEYETPLQRIAREKQFETESATQAPPFVADGIDLSKFQNLTALSMRCNKQSHLPNMEHLKELLFLDMDGNKVSNIDGPENASKKLRIIRLNRNNFSVMPNLENFDLLQALDLSFNNISDISNVDFSWKFISAVGLKGNSFSHFKMFNIDEIKNVDFDLTLHDIPAKFCPYGYEGNISDFGCTKKIGAPINEEKYDP
jgi:hypothetical protein